MTDESKAPVFHSSPPFPQGNLYPEEVGFHFHAHFHTFIPHAYINKPYLVFLECFVVHIFILTHLFTQCYVFRF